MFQEKLSNELLQVNQMLEAAQMSKEAAATLSREQQASKLAQQQASKLEQQPEVTQKASTEGSWVQYNEDSLPGKIC